MSQISVRRGRPPLDAAKRRQRILDAASSLFMERGFGETTIDAIASAVGVTKRTIYELVGDKEALFRAVCCESSSSAARVALPEVPADMGLSDALKALARSLLEHSTSPARTAVSRMIMLESMRFPNLARDVLEAGRSSVHEGIIAVLEQLETRGLVQIRDHNQAAKLFYDVLIGNLGFRVTLGFGDEEMDEDELDQRVRIFIDGYLKPSGC